MLYINLTTRCYSS